MFCRQEQSRSLLNGIRKQIEAARSTPLPGGALGQSLQLHAQLWEKTHPFSGISELELSNNLAENSMRRLQLDEKIGFTRGKPARGTEDRGDSFRLESCRRLKLPVRDYLAASFGLADLPIQRLPELTPAAWVRTAFK